MLSFFLHLQLSDIFTILYCKNIFSNIHNFLIFFAILSAANYQ